MSLYGSISTIQTILPVSPILLDILLPAADLNQKRRARESNEDR